MHRLKYLNATTGKWYTVVGDYDSVMNFYYRICSDRATLDDPDAHFITITDLATDEVIHRYEGWEWEKNDNV